MILKNLRMSTFSPCWHCMCACVLERGGDRWKNYICRIHFNRRQNCYYKIIYLNLFYLSLVYIVINLKNTVLDLKNLLLSTLFSFLTSHVCMCVRERGEEDCRWKKYICRIHFNRRQKCYVLSVTTTVPEQKIQILYYYNQI